MQLTDLTVEVRDGSFNRIGQLLPSDLVGATFVTRFNNVGFWSVRLPNGYALAEALRLPGAGLIVTGPTGVILSGPTKTARLEQTIDNSLGDWVIEGSDDSIVCSERLAYPLPSEADVTLQTAQHDIRTGFAETVIKGYVEANISAIAGTVRAIPNLTVEPDLGRGFAVSAIARFDNLQNLLYPLAQTGGIGFTVEQEDDLLVFKVYEPIDRSETVRMDLENNKLSKTEYSYLSPKATRAIVGGAGEGPERLMYEGTSTDSLLAESVWGRRIELFVDSRGADVESELTQSADEMLVDNGKTIVALSVTPSDDQNMRYGYEWDLGDRVTVVVGDIETSAVVTEVGISIQPDGVRIGATVGTPAAVDFESKLIQKQADQEVRISNIERNTTGYGVNTIYQPEGGTIGGTQPVFSGPGITGTYNRFGNMVHFAIEVDFTNITSFGTGQYYLTLPYDSLATYMFRDGRLQKVVGPINYHISGSVQTGSNQLLLWSSDKVASGVQDVAFTSSFPATLTTADNFHIAGTYEIAG